MRNTSSSVRLSELAEQFGLELKGSGDTLVTGVGTLSGATGEQIAFLSNPAYRDHLSTTRAAAVIVSRTEAERCPVSALIAPDPYVAYAKIAEHLHPPCPANPGVHPTASVDETAVIGANVEIGAQAAIGPGCVIGDACFIGPGSVLTRDCVVGESSRLVARVTLCDGVTIGKRAVIHPGAVIGSDGFGLAFDRDHWVKIPQLGSVRLGDDCEIGANTTIDRGAIGDTVLEDDVRLDNQVQIAHNVHVGAHTAMAGKAGVAGSTHVGKYCMFAGDSAAVGHIRIADRTTVSYRSVVTNSIEQEGTVWSASLPARPLKEWNRTIIHLRKLDELARRVLRLEKKLNSGNKQ